MDVDRPRSSPTRDFHASGPWWLVILSACDSGTGEVQIGVKGVKP